MPRFAANLSMMYAEHPFLDRFGAAAADGFDAVEYLFPYEHTPGDIAERLQRHGLTQALFNLPPGNWAAGERGLACLPGRQAEFAEALERALPYVQATGCRRLHCMAGLEPAGADRAALRQTYVANLRLACDRLTPLGATVLIEPINPRDMPGYHLSLQADAHAVCAEVARPNIAVQMDFYHCQITEGDLLRRLERHFAGVGHVQIAGVPDRHEPDAGEVNYPALFERLDQLGYDGFVGCEYRPAQGTSEGLGWLRRERARQQAAQEKA